MSVPHLSIVIPAYNEEARIAASLETVGHYLSRQPYSWEVVVVDDGSSDGTAKLVHEWAKDHEGFRVEAVAHRGKGWAVKHGMLAASGRYRFMCDADLAMPLDQVSRFLDRIAEGYDIVIGSRQAADARRFNEPLMRHIMGRAFNWTVRALAVRGFEDTQCGFKCFRGECAEDLFALQKTEGFGFDVEVLYLARMRALKVLEIPIDWYYQEASKVRHSVDSFLMLRDVIRVRWNDLQGKYSGKVSGREGHGEET